MNVKVREVVRLFPHLRESDKNYAQIVYLDGVSTVIFEGLGIHVVMHKKESPISSTRYTSLEDWMTFLRATNIEWKHHGIKFRKAKRWERNLFYKVIPEYLASLKLGSGVVDEQVVKFYSIEELLTHKEDKIRRGAQKFIQGG